VLAVLAELPPRVRVTIDTDVFVSLADGDREAVEYIAEQTGTHVVAYDLCNEGSGFPLCAAIRHARLERTQLDALERVERQLPPGVALVAYERPAVIRLPEEVLLRAAKRCATCRTGDS
jgi:hypothetical protein